MTASYSIDLRKKVVEVYKEGDTSLSKVANNFKISITSVKRYLKLDREKGDLSPIMGKQGRPGKIDKIGYKEIQKEFKIILSNEIHSGRYQPRKDFDQDSLQELASSIKEKGILQPIVVKKSEKGYELIAGERRWRAAEIAGLKQVPVIVCDISDNDALAYGLIENIQRQDLNPIEEANAFKRLLEEFSMTHEKVSQAIGRSRAMVTNMLRLLKLVPAVQEMLGSSRLEMGHARALLSLESSQQLIVAKKIIDKKLTVRAAEKLVSNLLRDRFLGNRSEGTASVSSDVVKFQKKLATKFKLPVSIHHTKSGQGRLVVKYSKLEELNNIC